LTDPRPRERSDVWTGAAIAFAVLIAAVTFVTERIHIAGLPVDAIVAGVPIAVLLAVPYLTRREHVRLRWELIAWPAGVFLAASLLSVIANGGRLGDLMTVFRYATYGVLTVVVGALATDSRIRRFLLWAIIVVGAATTLVAAFQYLNLEPTPGLEGLEPEIATRVRGTFNNANTYAEYLILVLGAGLALAVKERGRWRTVAVALSAVLFGTLLLTYTRGSWLALAIALAIAIPLAQPRLVAPVVAAVAAAIALSPGVLARVTGMLKLEGTAVFRIRLWRVGLAALGASPLLGAGPGRFLEAYEATVLQRFDLFTGYLRYGAHNSYLTLGVEIGLIGTAAFAVLVVFLATRGLFIASRDGVTSGRRSEVLILGAGLTAFVLNSLTSNCFQHPQAAVFFWLTAGLLIGAADETLDAPLADLPEPAPARGITSSSVAFAVWRRESRALRRAWRGSVLFRLGAVQPRPRGIVRASWTGRAARRLLAPLGRV